ncbi:excisionase family DNA-binding protein [Aureimonas psammosilenae]|uniref:excisionase family DNA-binding protein n=1 Tax=Aureimonas psammosilenae TaxID=2495496 RepID=UPI001260944E|nr:excisionase family DNA-binding protein [Aureimonas psammosilenae]
MSRGPHTFKQSDLLRAVKAARSAGLEIHQTEIHPDGRIILRHTLGAISYGPDTETGGLQAADHSTEIETTRAAVEHVAPREGQVFLKPEEVAKRWECSSRLIRRMIATGELRALQLGNRMFRVPIEAVEEHEDSQAQLVLSNTQPETLLPPQKRPRAKRLDVGKLAPLRGPQNRLEPDMTPTPRLDKS